MLGHVGPHSGPYFAREFLPIGEREPESELWPAPQFERKVAARRGAVKHVHVLHTIKSERARPGLKFPPKRFLRDRTASDRINHESMPI
jgi:hypothetical protein